MPESAPRGEPSEPVANTQRRRLLLGVPAFVSREFKNRSNTTPFLIWITFTLSFVLIRVSALLFRSVGNDYSDTTFYVGRNVVLGGYHIHHIAWGIALVAVAGWIGLHWKGDSIRRIAAIMYGLGLGFIVDELGFVVGGVRAYRGDLPEVITVGIALSGLFMSAVYFPSFWRGIRADLARIYRQVLALGRHAEVRKRELEPPRELGGK